MDTMIFAVFVIEIVSLDSNLSYSVPAFLFLAIWQGVNYFMSIHSYVLSLINSLVNGHQSSYACLYLLSLLRIQNCLYFLALRKGPYQFIQNTLSLDFLV